MNKEELADRYRSILARIDAAAARAGRPSGRVRLVAVTKTVGAEAARALVETGAMDLGENRVQALVAKRVALADLPVRWHMIGHLQTNKVAKVVGAATLIHGVDSMRLAEAINSAAEAAGVVQEIFLEVNVSGEESKYGLTPEGAFAAAVAIKGELPRVALAGLMTMAPISERPEETRPVFRGLKELADSLAAAGLFARSPYELSMGMTRDFEVAVEEGATYVRVGSGLFDGVEPCV